MGCCPSFMKELHRTISTDAPALHFFEVQYQVEIATMQLRCTVAACVWPDVAIGP